MYDPPPVTITANLNLIREDIESRTILIAIKLEPMTDKIWVDEIEDF
jgi:hypothetical protein